LKQVDFNGDFEYSKTKVLSISYPNVSRIGDDIIINISSIVTIFRLDGTTYNTHINNGIYKINLGEFVRVTSVDGSFYIFRK